MNTNSLDTTTCMIVRQCKKFASKTGNFVDIGSGSDLYYDFLSPYFNKVYCIEENKTLVEKISKDIDESFLPNVEIISTFDINNVIFLKISNYDLTRIFDLLKSNNFPPFIFFSSKSFESDKKYIEEIGYEIEYIMDRIFLAS